MFFIRSVLLVAIWELSFVFPNINTLLTLGGAVLGLFISVVLPVILYNRAYSEEFSVSQGDADSIA